jgi:hypothetical protein
VKVRIEIGELLLEGFDYHDHRRIASAMARELARLVGGGGPPRGPSAGDHTASITAPSFVMPFDKSPKRIGVEIARSVYKGMST